jgi:transmembrane sensor
MANQRLIELFNRFRSKTCTLAEKQELAILCLLPENTQVVETLLAETWNNMNVTESMPAEKADHILQLILQDAAAQPNTQLAPVKRMNWRRIAVAASILLAVSFGLYVISTKEKSLPTHDLPLTTHDIKAPDKNRAQIKLSDGSIVYLDSAANGELANVNGVQVTKTEDGKIIYTTPSAAQAPTAVAFNTLSNPRGSKVIDMTLSDGSHVWLNAGSSITYPVAFIGNQRKVEITGEAYFEIAKHELPAALAAGKKGVRMPFIVSANNKADVEVLGTHFNVNSYDDESEIKVTLLEGSVKVSNKQSALTIKPNQQAVIAKNEAISLANSFDIEQTMSWKNGLFSFKAADIKTIMKEIERWYDVEVVYTAEIKPKFFLKASRDISVSNIFKILEATGAVHLEIDGRKIIVKP